MKKYLLVAAALALGVQPGLALRAGPASNGWFRVTEPISACEAVDTFTPCEMVQLKVGEVFYLDPQDEGVKDIAGFVHMARPPAMNPVLVVGSQWRHAFKPTHAPKGR